jgi:hypothetical protein
MTELALGELDSDFGNAPGAKRWNPSTAITIPVKIKNPS